MNYQEKQLLYKVRQTVIIVISEYLGSLIFLKKKKLDSKKKKYAMFSSIPQNADVLKKGLNNGMLDANKILLLGLYFIFKIL